MRHKHHELGSLNGLFGGTSHAAPDAAPDSLGAAAGGGLLGSAFGLWDKLAPYRLATEVLEIAMGPGDTKPKEYDPFSPGMNTGGVCGGPAAPPAVAPEHPVGYGTVLDD